jgi:hypothetical protein
MKYVILNGQKITIGSKVRFVYSQDLYVGRTASFNLPEVGNVYTVRGFTNKGGFYLEEVKNQAFRFLVEGVQDETAEPGFAVWRFEAATPLMKKKIVNIEVKPLELMLN